MADLEADVADEPAQEQEEDEGLVSAVSKQRSKPGRDLFSAQPNLGTLANLVDLFGRSYQRTIDISALSSRLV